MKLYAFAVHDSKAEFFSTPFFTRSLGEGLRGFEDEVNNKESQLNRHAGDFNLYLVGSFETENGRFEEIDPVHHGSALEYLPKDVNHG